jgi:Zn-dependent M28 family amino/carboxypeptidase
MKITWQPVKLKYSLAILVLLIIGASCTIDGETPEKEPPVFDGQKAYNLVDYQVALGPRFPGSAGHESVRNWIVDELDRNGWQIRVNEHEISGNQIFKIVAYRQYAANIDQEWIILGAHYDTRMVSDRDPDPLLRSEPVPGANDGASGVAVLLELARILPSFPNSNIWLVFFDAEDNGRVPGWEWIMGSTVFVEDLPEKPDKVVIIDMIGDKDQNIYIEKSSDPELVAEIWDVAKELGIETFIPEPKYHIIDDHTPFLNQGIAAVDIIDFDYPFWHTTQDTLDKVSAESLKNVGDVILTWLARNQSPKD